jgi:peptide/nickel transport system permease protein
MLPDGGEVQVISSGWRLAAREFVSNRLAVPALLLLIAIILFCFIGPSFYHSDQSLANPLAATLAPGQAPIGGGASHILGTDENGLDELGRIMLGGQSAIEIGAFASLVAIVIGTLYGAISGLIGGVLDAVLMRFVDILLSIPLLLIVLVLATKYNGTVVSISMILGIFSWLAPARLVRGEVLTLRERDFVVASQTMGSGRWRLITRHLIPNAMSVTIVNITFLIADSILIIAFLGFLGYGLQFPNTSWGDMLSGAQQYVQSGQWWLVYPVGGFLVAVILCCNLIGDALRDAVDVRLRRR